MKHVGIDCRFGASHSGLGRYTREVTRHLIDRRQSDGVHYTLFVRDLDENWLQRLPTDSVTLVSAPFAHYSVAEQLRFPLLLRKSGIKLLFVPHFNVPFLCPVPFCVTVHDLILHRYPNHASLIKRLLYRLVLGRAVAKARRIFAVSTFTAKELTEAFGDKISQKLTVAHLGVEPYFAPSSHAERSKPLQKYQIDNPYFLYVGNAKEHKNVQTLLDAFARLPRHFELLLVTGGKEAAHLQLPPRARILENVPDTDLPALYSGAQAVVTASLYEGFCLPVAEASACGARVIASNCGAIPEVAGEGVLLIEPTEDAFAEAMQRSGRLPLARASRLFSWIDTSASIGRSLDEVYSSL